MNQDLFHLNNMRGFTKEEAERYEKSLMKLFKPTGRNRFDLEGGQRMNVTPKQKQDLEYELGFEYYLERLCAKLNQEYDIHRYERGTVEFYEFQAERRAVKDILCEYRNFKSQQRF